jgi:hypothetical protein
MATKSEIFAKISQARQELNTLYTHLGHSLRIQELWPDAFLGDCKCTPILSGIDWPRGYIIPYTTQGYPTPYHRVRSIKRTCLRRSDGVEYDVTPEEFFSIFTSSIADSPALGETNE